jgi:hypothetical protein
MTIEHARVQVVRKPWMNEPWMTELWGIADLHPWSRIEVDPDRMSALVARPGTGPVHSPANEIVEAQT